jgi:hypothetical protein
MIESITSKCASQVKDGPCTGYLGSLEAENYVKMTHVVVRKLRRLPRWPLHQHLTRLWRLQRRRLTADALFWYVAVAANAWAYRPDTVLDAFFLLYAASLVIFMQLGFVMISTGCVWVNKVHNTLLNIFLDACGTSLGWYTVVYVLVFGGTAKKPTTFIGSENFFLVGVKNDSLWIFQFAFCGTSTTIVGWAIICVTVFLRLLGRGAWHDSNAGFVSH